MFWLIYIALGFFFGAGTLTAAILYTDLIKQRLFGLGLADATPQVWMWYAIFAGAFITFLWLPTLLFLAFIVFWTVLLRYARKHVHIEMPKS